MDLDDFDDVDAPKQAPARAAKFVPKSSRFKPQPKGKTAAQSSSKPEDSVAKTEPQEPLPSALPSAPASKEEDEDIKPKLDAAAKAEAEAWLEMEVDAAKREAEDGNDHMDVDGGEEGKEDDDVIVREIDVFVTPSVDTDTQLYVLQYPLRPRWRPYELDDRCREVRVKPSTSEVEVDLSIDDSMNWDADYARALEMTKRTLSSVWAPPTARAGYAVGVLIGNKLHLNPVKAVVQLRPSLQHVESKDAGIAIKKEESSQAKRAGPSKKQNTQTATVNGQVSDAGETWVPLKYHDSKSDMSSTYMEKMVTQEHSPIDFTMSSYDYMSSMCPGASNSGDKPKGPSRRFLLSLPLEERIQKLLMEGPALQKFGAIKHFAPESTSEDLLTMLEEHGQLVQGLWTAKTSLLVPPTDRPKHLARDYVLLKFNEGLEISSSIIRVHPKFQEDMKLFLNTFGVERPSLGDWKFKEQTDWSFIKQFPRVVEKYKKSYESAWKNISEILGKVGRVGSSNKSTARGNVPSNPAKKLGSDKSTTTRTATSMPTKGSITRETQEVLKKVLPKIFQTHKVCSYQFICQNLRDQAVQTATLPKADPRVAKAAASAADAPQEEFEEVINEYATKIHGFYVLKSSPDHPEFDPLRRVVMDLLMARGPNAKLKKAEIMEAAQLALKRTVPNNEYQKVVTELCESKGSAWMLKSGDGKPS
ncbi:unnamed protein product [Linum trigynum]|uniref:DNA-directed RNA polymerase III subunit RPC5 n=1 Tax=Linum trigynum TaxID=586398 RepID=A0AAV2DSY9_9ROSI